MSKLKSIGVCNQELDWFSSYLLNRKQLTVVGNCKSPAAEVKIGVPQGSILGPLLFLVFVNDLPTCLQHCELVMYADDTVIYYSGSLKNVEHCINSDLSRLAVWFSDNRLTLNIPKSKFMVFGTAQSANFKSAQAICAQLNGTALERTKNFKYLGVIVNENMSWADQVDLISKKINQRIGVIRRVSKIVPLDSRVTLYNSLVAPLFDYGDIIWGDKNNETLMKDLQLLQNKAAKTVLDRPPSSSASDALRSLNMKPLSERRKLHRLITVYIKCLNNGIDFDFDFKLNSSYHNYNTRSKNNLHLKNTRTNFGQQRFVYQAANEWNNLEINIRKSSSLVQFKSKILYL